MLIVATMLFLGCAAPVAPTPQLLPDGSTRHRPRSTPVSIGASADIRLYTHCGLEQTPIDFAGLLWTPVADMRGAGMRAQMIYNDPADHGTITLVGPRQAAYLTQMGQTILLRPLEGPLDAAPCY
jgi:hypothetical protein